MSHSIEVEEIRGFLGRCIPFDQLPDDLLTLAARAVTVRYFRHGSGSDLMDPRAPKLYVVRSGAFEVRTAQDELVDRVDEGGTFGYPSLLTGDAVTNRVVVLEDGLVYQIEEATFQQLRAGSREFDRFFNRAYANRLRQAVRFRDKNHQLVQHVRQLLTKRPVTVTPSARVTKAAAIMTRERISSLLVVDAGELVGIVTDRDLRARVLGEGRGGDTPVAMIMTASPFTVAPDCYVFEAMMQMSQHNIHHLPVVEGGEPVGVLTTTDIFRAQKSDPIYLIGEIGRQHTVEGLQRVSRDTPELLRNLIAMDARAEEIGRVSTLVTDAITRQLMRQAMDRLGEAPVPFAWLAFGSQARQEQTALSDQDNALLLSDAARPEHDAYFAALAQHVCDGLNACAYAYCHGGIMATNPRWRQPLRAWQGYFLPWINEPSPEALMHSSIFFDMRMVYGEPALFSPLQRTVLEATQSNTIFLACLAQNALQITPPLGFFKQFVLERNGEHANKLDLKHRGVVPIIDIARIYALAAGLPEVNTVERLTKAGGTEMLSERDAHDLCDAFEYIAHLRLMHQGRQMVEGENPDNHLRPESVSDLARHQLRDAFDVVNNAQAALRMKFTGGYL
jgi:CBS domain-containing protein